MRALLLVGIASSVLVVAPQNPPVSRARQPPPEPVPAEHGVEPVCPPAGCPIPVPYPAVGTSRVGGTPQPSDPQPTQIGDEPGVLTGHGPIRSTPVPGVKFRTVAPDDEASDPEPPPPPRDPDDPPDRSPNLLHRTKFAA